MNEITTNENKLIIPDYQFMSPEIAALPLIYPYLQIAQSMGKNEKFAGKIVDNSGTPIELSQVIIVKLGLKKAKWRQPYDPAIKEPLCRSLDGKTPDLNLFLSGKAEGRPPAAYCANCPDNVTEDAAGEWKRPRCDDQYVLWGFDLIGDMPFILTLSGLSLSSKSQTPGKKSFKQWLSQIKMRRQPPYMLTTEISVGKAKGGKGSSYVGLFNIIGQTDIEKLKACADIIQAISHGTEADLEKAEDSNWEDDSLNNQP